jgi:hypothetical protein
MLQRFKFVAPNARPPALQWLASVAQGLAEDGRLWRPLDRSYVGSDVRTPC